MWCHWLVTLTFDPTYYWHFGWSANEERGQRSKWLTSYYVKISWILGSTWVSKSLYIGHFQDHNKVYQKVSWYFSGLNGKNQGSSVKYVLPSIGSMEKLKKHFQVEQWCQRAEYIEKLFKKFVIRIIVCLIDWTTCIDRLNTFYTFSFLYWNHCMLCIKTKHQTWRHLSNLDINSEIFLRLWKW